MASAPRVDGLAEFLQFAFSGLTVGAIYALVALGFTLIFNSSDVVNFAQGEFVMLGGMVTVFRRSSRRAVAARGAASDPRGGRCRIAAASLGHRAGARRVSRSR